MASNTVVHETIEWGPATGVGMAAAICGEPKRPKPITLARTRGLDV